ncbi:hypothetical protein [Natronobacterium gregoryi]|uniref:Uncharacterized protein n=2 Tax=Natronobacterium gregoryi TaxID=44930 RepID=L0AJW5_NATGS|nr:hypothetical protein [Natronobacterium gregoryi]AFZ73477.1 hypothetical protein Natgr_2301 [Natronobacterium gregoryi SP2]ELY68331.1 hypothetical protein C490_09663 [Natronobacterium gregoryi SP2]PLK20508.1 hypothetical protein CYV19_09270 [Natronobacterium gregoryi SP2]SFI71083.1 hypothetical protein SAMN05443661_10425 [Natronobacterium gregoryi]
MWFGIEAFSFVIESGPLAAVTEPVERQVGDEVTSRKLVVDIVDTPFRDSCRLEVVEFDLQLLEESVGIVPNAACTKEDDTDEE